MIPSQAGPSRIAYSSLSNIPPNVIPLLKPYLPHQTSQNLSPTPTPSPPYRPTPRLHQPFGPSSRQTLSKRFIRNKDNAILPSSSAAAQSIPLDPRGLLAALGRQYGLSRTRSKGGKLWRLLAEQESRQSTTRKEKKRLYDDIIRSLFDDPSLINLNFIYTIFQLQVNEGIQTAPIALTRWLQYSIKNTDQSNEMNGLEPEIKDNEGPENQVGGITRNPYLRLIEKILPFTPYQMDFKLLTLILSTLIRHSNISSIEIKRIIDDCYDFDSDPSNPTSNEMDRAHNEYDADNLKVKGKGKALDQDDVTSVERGNGVGGNRWELGLWDVCINSILREGDWKRSVLALGEFREVIKSRYRLRISATSTLSHGTKGEIWSQNEMEGILRPYISILAYWSSSHFLYPQNRPDQHNRGRSEAYPYGRGRTDDRSLNIRRNSKVPLMLMRDLVQLIGISNFNMEVVNCWMNAERIIGNNEKVRWIWNAFTGIDSVGGQRLTEEERISYFEKIENYLNPFPSNSGITEITIQTPQSINDDLQLPVLDEVSLLPSLSPTSQSYSTLFKSLKYTSSNTLPDTQRPIIRSFLDSTGSETINTESLNSALSLLFLKPTRSTTIEGYIEYFRLIKTILDRYSISNPDRKINSRGVDIVSAGLIRLWKSSKISLEISVPAIIDRYHLTEEEESIDTFGTENNLPIFPFTHQEFNGSYAAPPPPPPSGSFSSYRESQGKYNLSLREWDLISNELHRIKKKINTNRMDEDSKGETTLLPVGAPLARLADEYNASYRDTKDRNDGMITRLTSVSSKRNRQKAAEELLGPLKVFIMEITDRLEVMKAESGIQAQ